MGVPPAGIYCLYSCPSAITFTVASDGVASLRLGCPSGRAARVGVRRPEWGGADKLEEALAECHPQRDA